MHYKETGYFFYPILIGAIVFVSAYIVIMFLIIIFEVFKKYKALRALYIILPLIILGEAFYSGFITFSNVGSTNYLYNTNTIRIYHTITNKKFIIFNIKMQPIIIHLTYLDYTNNYFFRKPFLIFLFLYFLYV